MSYVEGRLGALVDKLSEQQREMMDKLTEQQGLHFERLEMLLQIVIGHRNSNAPSEVQPFFTADPPTECAFSGGESEIGSPVPPEREPIVRADSLLWRPSAIAIGSDFSQATLHVSPSSNNSIARERNRQATKEPCDARHVWHKYVPRGSKRIEVLRRSVMNGTALQRVKTSRYYEIFIMLVIISNSCYIGFKTEYDAQTYPVTNENCYDCNGAGLAFYWVDLLYLVVFLSEWTLRVCADGRAFFKPSSLEFGWNAFDTFTLAMMLTDEVSVYIIPGGVHSSQLSVLRLLRMVRVFRAFRLIRVLKFLRELRIVMNTVVLALRSLIWTFCVITMMVYVFAIVFTQGTLDHCAFEDACAENDSTGSGLLENFGTISKSGLTLFMTMSNGISWREVFFYLFALNPLYPIAYIAFVCLALFALLNVINGVFVETTLHAAKLDDIAVIEDEIRVREKYLERLHGIFNALDLDGDGVLSIAEFDIAFKDERVVALFSAAGIDVENSRILFNLIDKDLDGNINLEDFWRGCMQLKGEAKALDLFRLQIDINWLCKNVRFLRSLAAENADERHIRSSVFSTMDRRLSSQATWMNEFEHRSVSKRSIARASVRKSTFA